MKKEMQLHCLPSINGINDGDGFKYHLYITSDAYIRAGDLFFDNMGKMVFRAPKNSTEEVDYINLSSLNRNKKIEITTDKSLNLPLINPEFVKSYAEWRGNVEKVLVEMEEQIFETFTRRIAPKLQDGYAIISAVSIGEDWSVIDGDFHSAISAED